WLDDQNNNLHYAPVWHTARTGGATSLFWAKYSERLPIGYRPEFDRPRPPDWQAWAFTGADLPSFTHLLLCEPDLDDEDRRQDAFRRVREAERQGKLERLGSSGRWTLYAPTARQLARGD